MKSLYESILSSTNTGKAGEALKVIEWFKSTRIYESFLKFGNQQRQSFFKSAEVKATPKGGYWIIDIDGKDGDTSVSIDTVGFFKSDTPNGSGVLPYNIYCVRVNGKPTNISYQQLKDAYKSMGITKLVHMVTDPELKHPDWKVEKEYINVELLKRG